MRLYVQWTKLAPEDWVTLDLDESGQRRRVWERLPTRSEPAPGQLGGEDNIEGWVFAVNIQGVEFAGRDHYSVIPIPGGLQVTVWDDDPIDFPPGERDAAVWTFLTPAPDPTFGGSLNTRQSRVIYTEHPEWYTLDKRTLAINPWSAFVPPDAVITRHGVWTTQEKMLEHLAARSPHHWREWVT